MPNFQPAPAFRPTAIANGRTNSMSTQKVVNYHCKTGFHRVVCRPLAVKAMADVFIQSLVLAGFCSDHAPRKQPSPVHKTTTPNRLSNYASSPIYKHNNRNIEKSIIGLRQFAFVSNISHWRSFNTHAASKDPDDRYNDVSNDFTSIDTSNERIDANRIDRTNLVRRTWNKPRNERYRARFSRYQARVLRPGVNKSSNKLIVEKRSQDYALSRDLELFLEALNDKSKSNQYVFSLYKRLPSPGVNILTTDERRILLYRFSHPPDRRRFNARSYLNLFDDMIQSGFHISVPMCRAAIYFISHRVPVLEERDLQDAITVWQRMEKVYGLKSDNVMFELLFMLASETGQFTVADRFLSEMTSRGLHLTRYGYMNVIFSYGKRGDIQAIHQQFESYVRSGQLVDTGVINCLISSLLNSGDSGTAEQLYLRMMDEHRKTVGTTLSEGRNHLFSPSLSSDFAIWNSDTKRLNTVLDNYLLKKNNQPDGREKPLQDVVHITPNTRTFHILFRHHCIRTGDMKAVSRLLMDMEKVFEVPPRSFIYYFLFRGFAIHSADKGWTEDGLQEVWRTFSRTLYESYTRMGRLENDESLLPKWENPLRSIYETTVESSHDHAEEQQGEYQSQGGEAQPTRAAKPHSRKYIVSEGENLMELFDEMEQLGKYHTTWHPRKNLSRRIENGVFLSRELNIVILKAFGSHGGSNSLLRVFSEIETMWKPWKRLGSDVQGVKKELQRQLVRAQNRERQLLDDQGSK